jgi:hypothetical protein
MQNSLGTLVAIVIIAGGFLLTGDLGWCARRGLQLIQRSPPTDLVTAPAAGPPDETAEETADKGGDEAAGQADSAVGSPGGSATEPTVEPLAPATPHRTIPDGGPERVDLSFLSAGARLFVWTRSGGREPVCHVCDVVDPASGEALVRRRGVIDGQTIDAAAQRVRIVSSTPGGSAPATPRLDRGGPFLLVPLGLAHDRRDQPDAGSTIIALGVE